MKNLNSSNNSYNISLKIKANDFKTAFFNINLNKSNNFIAKSLIFSIIRKKKEFDIEFLLIFFNKSDNFLLDFFKTNAKITFWPLENSTNLTKTLYNSSKSNNSQDFSINFNLKLIQGFDYQANFIIKTRFYDDFSGNLDFSLKEANFSIIPVLLSRKKVDIEVSGLIRDARSLKSLRNVTILLTIFDKNENSGIETLLFSNRKGGFSLLLPSNQTSFYSGSNYELILCFKKTSYRKLCEKGYLSWKNNYTRSYSRVFLKKKTIFMNLNGSLIGDNKIEDSRTFKVFIRINRLDNYQYKIKKGFFRIGDLEILRY